MIKVLSREQIKELDAVTIQKEGISSLELMERAANMCALHIMNLLSDRHKCVHFVCGKGNNGGDGLAVARIIRENYTKSDLKINIFIIETGAYQSADFISNYNTLENAEKINITIITEENHEKFKDCIFSERQDSILIDAIYGTGLNRAVTGLAAQVIETMNSSLIPIISIDMPSGLMTDEKTLPGERAVIRSSLTLTFQQPKYSMMLSENGRFCSDFITMDIGLDKEFISYCSCSNFFIEKNDISSLLKKREKFSHKGNYGHALIIAGSLGKSGAAVLAAKACLNSGSGLLTVHCPACSTQILQTAVPEAMVSEDSNPQHVSNLPDLSSYNAIGLGPGLGTNEDTGFILKQCIQNYSGKLVLDADGINLLAENKTLLAFLPPLTILTPHPKEFDRLTTKHDSDFDRIETAKTIALKHHLIIILKSAHTAIITPNQNIFFNSSGNPGMAKGGSGDVLTGIITGLLARGYNPLDAATIGVYIHGLCGDLATEKCSEESLLASNIIENIGKGFSLLEKI